MNKIVWTVAVTAVVILGILFLPRSAKTPTEKADAPVTVQQVSPNDQVRSYLETKESPLAPETDYLLAKEHWKLLIAISAIESQYCKRQLGYNCWGVGGDSAYRKYSSIRAAIDDADALIEHWHDKGRWLTVEDMNCSYVVPCSPNWEAVVTKVLNAMHEYDRRTPTIPR